jgi:hypothetical protein
MDKEMSVRLTVTASNNTAAHHIDTTSGTDVTSDKKRLDLQNEPRILA